MLTERRKNLTSYLFSTPIWNYHCLLGFLAEVFYLFFFLTRCLFPLSTIHYYNTSYLLCNFRQRFQICFLNNLCTSKGQSELYSLYMNSLWIDTLSSLTEIPLSLHTSQYWRSLITVLIMSQDFFWPFFLAFFFLIIGSIC